MEMHHRQCVLPSNAPALPEGTDVNSRVLQERSGNRRHDSFSTDASTSWKRNPSSPVENLYNNLGGGYFAGNITAHLHGEKTDEQIDHETAKLWRLVQRSDKYAKYRDRQPQNQKKEDEKWPNKLEHAFFRGLVRWPPMGRRKHMLEGRLRGRNELVADSIFKDTGIPRTRKQVSSHIQVLKNILSDVTPALIYMSTEDMGAKRKRHASPGLGHLRRRHAPAASKYDYSRRSSVWPGYGPLPSSSTLATPTSRHLPNPNIPFMMTSFALYVQDGNRNVVHYVSSLADRPHHEDMNVSDITPWKKQYPELAFHKTQEWSDRQLLVCDASIKVMTDKLPSKAELAVNYDVLCQDDLSFYDELQCRTRFYESGEVVIQEPEPGNRAKESQLPCTYDSQGGSISIPFGSQFWALKLSNLSKEYRNASYHGEQEARMRIDRKVRKPLQCLTAAQDICGVLRESGEERCFLTILWRFTLARSHEPAGKTTWRVVRFEQPAHCRWMKSDPQLGNRSPKVLTDTTSGPPPQPATSVYPSLPLDFPHHGYAPQQQALDLDGLSTIALEGIPGFGDPHSATAQSMSMSTTDYSQTQSLPSLTHSNDTCVGPSHQDFPDSNDIDFTGGHINICLEPAINLGALEPYTSAHPPSLNPLNAMTGLETHAGSVDNGTFDFSGLTGCYPTKPWPYPDPVSHLERYVEQHSGLGLPEPSSHNHNIQQHDHNLHHAHEHGLQRQQHHQQSFQHDNTTHSQNIAGHGVLHDGQVNNGLWKLQSPFAEDAGVDAGAVDQGRGLKGEGEGENVGGDGGLLALIEREQRERQGYRGPY